MDNNPNRNPDGSKKRKRDEDTSEGVIKRHRDEDEEKGESAATPQIPAEEGANTPQPSSSTAADDPTPGCSYTWKAQSAEVQEKVKPENADMEWRQMKEPEVEEDARADSGCSGVNDETEEEDDEEGETTCTLVSRPYYPSEDESWEDDFVLQMSSISVREQERTFGPQPDPNYDAALAMLEGWDWPDPDEAKAAQEEEAEGDGDVLLLEDWGDPIENQGERWMNEGEGEEVINPTVNSDADKENMDN